MVKKATIGIGDGMNDAEMLTLLQDWYCYGERKRRIKKLADDVTKSVDEDGLYASFLKHGLL